jgi:hypothetical protein
VITSYARTPTMSLARVTGGARAEYEVTAGGLAEAIAELRS